MDDPQTTPPSGADAAKAAAHDRLLSLDFIRGIAVMGILWANIVGFGQPMTAYMYPDAFAVPHGQTSDWLWVLQFVLIDGKMRGLFTLLFGAGLMLFMEKAWARGQTRWLQARRLCWLLAFGLIHFYFIWKGDILVLYSIAGIAAMAFLRLKAMNQLILGLLGYGAGAIMFLMMMLPPYLIAETEWGDRAIYAQDRAAMELYQAEEIADGVTETAIIRGGNYVDFVRYNFTEHGTEPVSGVMMFILETLPLMLIGMALYQMGVFDGRMNAGAMRRWGWTGIIVGSALTLVIALWSMGEGFTYWGTLAAFIGLSPLPRLPATLGLLALLALWAPVVRGWLGARVTAAGRMAFSNYLGTSVVMLLVFHGWAGGLFGYLNRPQLYLIATIGCGIMLLWSKPWLERFRYGPLEWLWRCLTYWRFFPLKR